MIVQRIVLAAACAAALVSCGGGGGGSAPSGSNAAPSLPVATATPQSGAGTASFTIVIPSAAAASSAHARKPAYVSPNTQSIAVFAYVSSATPPPTATTVVNVGPNLPNCTSVATGTSCTLTVPATYGPMTFVMKMYDGTNATGDLLSSGTVAATIAASSPPIPLTLNGVVTSIQLALSSPNAPAGGGTVTLIVNALDPSGATIVGPGNYNVPINITSSDASVTVSPAQVTSPSQTVTVTYTASSPSSVVFRAGAQGLSAGADGAVALSIAQPTSQNGVGQIYLADTTGLLYAFSANSSGRTNPSNYFGIPASCQNCYGLAADAAGNLAVSDSGNPNTVFLYPANFPTSPRQTLHVPGYSPLIGTLALDGQDNLYVFTPGEVEVYPTVFTSGSSTSPIRSVTINGLPYNDGIAVDSAGDLFVIGQDNNYNGVVQVFAPSNYGPSPTRTIALTQVTSYEPNLSIAVAGDGTMAALYADQNTGTIETFAPGASTPSTTLGNNPYLPDALLLAFGANDDLYVIGGTGFSSALVFPLGSNGTVAPSRTFSSSNVVSGSIAAIAIGGLPSAVRTGPTSISGDMLALTPSATWNYNVIGPGVTPYTVTTYADPQPVNGATALIAYANTSVTANALPSNGGTIVATAGFTTESDGAHVLSFGSATNNSFGIVPGAPLLVPSTLSLGQTFVPTAGITASVTGISSTAPGLSACPNAPPYAVRVSYVSAFGNGTSSETVVYAPGCGIISLETDNGTNFQLKSTGTDPGLGEQSLARRTLEATWVDTFRTLWHAAWHQ